MSQEQEPLNAQRSFAGRLLTAGEDIGERLWRKAHGASDLRAASMLKVAV